MENNVNNNEIDHMIETMTHPARIHGAGDGMLNLVWELANEQTEPRPPISPRQQLPLFEIGAGDNANQGIPDDGQGRNADALIDPLPIPNINTGCIRRLILTVRNFFLEMFQSRESLRGYNYVFILIAIGSGIMVGRKNAYSKNFL